MRKPCDEVDRYHGWPTHSIDATAAFMESFAVHQSSYYVRKLLSTVVLLIKEGALFGPEGPDFFFSPFF